MVPESELAEPPSTLSPIPMPFKELPEITLFRAAKIVGVKALTEIPLRFPSANCPETSVPIKLPCTVKLLKLLKFPPLLMPSRKCPEIRLRAAAVAPPMMSGPPPLLAMIIPSPDPAAAVPEGLVPIKFPSMWQLEIPMLTSKPMSQWLMTRPLRHRLRGEHRNFQL